MATCLLLARLLAALVTPSPEVATLPDAASTRLVVEAVGDGPAKVSPRSVVSFAFRVRNSSRAAVAATWALGADPTWRALGPVRGQLRLEEGASETLLVTLSVPGESAPGEGSVRLRLYDDRGGPMGEGVASYVVLAAGELEFAVSEAGATPTAWGPYATRSWLSNRSNVAIRVELEAQSSMSWPILLEPTELTIEAGGGAWIEARVRPPVVRPAEVSNTVSLTARTADLPAGRSEAVSRRTATVLSESGASGRPVLRGWTEVESLLSQRQGGASLNAALFGFLDRHRKLDLRLGERLPIGSEDVLSRRASYIDLEDVRYGGLLVGRTSYAFTRLTAFPQWGDWAEARGYAGPLDVTLFSSTSEPDTLIGRMRGGSVHLGDAAGRSYGVTAYRGERAPSVADSGFEMATAWTRQVWGRVELEAEAALGRLDDGGRETALRLASNGVRGRWDWSGEAQSASERFPGTLWNMDEAWGSVGFALTSDLRVWVGGLKQLSRDLAVSPAADVERSEAGVNWRAFDRASLSLGHSRTTFGVTSEQLERRIDALTHLRLDVELGVDLLASVEVDVGERRQGGVRERVTRPGYTLRYRPSRNWLLRLQHRPEVEVQEIFDFRQRWTFLARWQAASGTWIDVSGQELECGRLAAESCSDEPAVQLSLGHRLGGAHSRWQLIGFAQRQGGRDVVSGIRIRRDITLRSPFGGGRRQVLGEVLLPPGAPIPVGARVRLGDRVARIDPEGRFRVRGLAPGRHPLTIEPEALGVSLVADPEHTVGVFSEDRQPARVSLRLHAPGAIEGRVLAAAGALTGGERPMGGLTLHFEHLRWPHLRRIAVTDSNGRYSVHGLMPGRWRVRLGTAELPADLAILGAGRLEIEVGAGATRRVAPLRLGPRRRDDELRQRPPLVLEGNFWSGGGSGSGGGG